MNDWLILKACLYHFGMQYKMLIKSNVKQNQNGSFLIYIMKDFENGTQNVRKKYLYNFKSGGF